MQATATLSTAASGAAANGTKPANGPLAHANRSSPPGTSDESTSISIGVGGGSGGLRAASGATGTSTPVSNDGGAGAVVNASRKRDQSGGVDGSNKPPPEAAVAAPTPGTALGKPVSTQPWRATEPAAAYGDSNSSATAATAAAAFGAVGVQQTPVTVSWRHQHQQWPPPRSHNPSALGGAFAGGGGYGDRSFPELGALGFSEISLPGSGLAMPGAVGGHGWLSPSCAGLTSLQVRGVWAGHVVCSRLKGLCFCRGGSYDDRCSAVH